MYKIKAGGNDTLFEVNDLPYRKGLYEVFYIQEAFEGIQTVGIRNIHNQEPIVRALPASQYEVSSATFEDTEIIELVEALSVVLGFKTGGGGGSMTPSEIKVAYESNPNTNAYTDAEKTKLGTLQNYDDTAILSQIDTKVDKVAGKGLSTNDYTTTEKNKLAGLTNYTLPSATDTVLGGVKNWYGTQSAYDAIVTKDPTVQYFIQS